MKYICKVCDEDGCVLDCKNTDEKVKPSECPWFSLRMPIWKKV